MVQAIPPICASTCWTALASDSQHYPSQSKQLRQPVPGVLAHIVSVARAPAFALQLRKRITSFVIQNQQSLVRGNRLLRHGKVTLGTH
jgi:hypothetical protein